MEKRNRLLHRQQSELAEHDEFLSLVLGLVASARRAEYLFGEAASAQENDAAHPPTLVEGSSRDTFAHFTLGVISFAGNLMAGVEALPRPAVADTDQPAARQPIRRPRDLLV